MTAPLIGSVSIEKYLVIVNCVEADLYAMDVVIAESHLLRTNNKPSSSLPDQSH